jgi:hypothetical protein
MWELSSAPGILSAIRRKSLIVIAILSPKPKSQSSSELDKRDITANVGSGAQPV